MPDHPTQAATAPEALAERLGLLPSPDIIILALTPEQAAWVRGRADDAVVYAEQRREAARDIQQHFAAARDWSLARSIRDAVDAGMREVGA